MDGYDSDDDNFLERWDVMMRDDNKQIIVKSDDYKFCDTCQCEMEVNINNMYICPNCGVINNIITDNNEYDPSITKNYHINDTFHLPIIAKGPDAYKYNSFIRNYTSNNENIHKNAIIKKLNQRFMFAKKINIPRDIINKTIEKYIAIKKFDKSYRAVILESVIGIILYYECLNHKIAIKTTEIAEWMHIPPGSMTKSDKIVKSLQEEGIINIELNDECFEKDFINSYLNRLNIDNKYVDFLYDLYLCIEENTIGNMHARLSTKAASLIFLLTKLEPIDITDEYISQEYKISVTTLKNYVSCIAKSREYVEEIFVKHNYDFNLILNKKQRKPKFKTISDKKKEKLELAEMTKYDKLKKTKSTRSKKE